MTRIDETNVSTYLLELAGADEQAYVIDMLSRLFQRFEGIAVAVIEVEADPDPLAPSVKVRVFSDFTPDHPLRDTVASIVRRKAAALR